jgi:toxin YoeB
MKNKKAQNKQQAKSDGINWTPHAWEDYVFWQTENPQIANEINNLIDECRKDPFRGTGKPEPLSGNLTGYWSRRITREHRLVYLPEDGNLYIVACRFHYDNV